MKGLTLNTREQKRLQVMNMVLEGVCGVVEAAEIIDLSHRQVWRLLSAYRKEGAKALAHGNRGRQPVSTLSQEVKGKIVELSRNKYEGVNHCHFTELLAEREELLVSRSTLRRILTCAGIRSPRKRRLPKHRCRRERYFQEGMLLQIDGSEHDWLEGRGTYLTLVGAIDDATGIVPYALFRQEEDAQGYFMLLSEIIKNKGIPLALYSDRHGIFQRSPKDSDSLEEQLSGQRQPTQFGRALQELCIQPIFAMSPQAKGRIERLWGTFQDRLVSELRLAGASTINEANQVLWDFLPRFNARFSVPPAQPGSAYRQLPVGLCLEGILCFKYGRTVDHDNTIRFDRQVIQLLPGLDRSSYTRARVEVQERLDGSLIVSYHGQIIAIRKAPPNPASLRARKGPRSAYTTPAREVVATVNPLVVGVQMNDVTGCGHCREETTIVQGQSKANGSISQPYKPPADHPWRKLILT